jgi:hypothetical protein
MLQAKQEIHLVQVEEITQQKENKRLAGWDSYLIPTCIFNTTQRTL